MSLGAGEGRSLRRLGSPRWILDVLHLPSQANSLALGALLSALKDSVLSGGGRRFQGCSSVSSLYVCVGEFGLMRISAVQLKQLVLSNICNRRLQDNSQWRHALQVFQERWAEIKEIKGF